MKYSLIKSLDCANGPGCRVSVFVSGCRHQCPNCFNKLEQDFSYGKEFNNSTITEIIGHLAKPYIKGITILGGEPMEPENQFDVWDLLNKCRNYFRDSKTYWCYTGAIYEDLLNPNKRYLTSYTRLLLGMLDVLVDGPYVEALRDIQNTPFRGSTNQRLIDIKRTLIENKVINYVYTNE